MNAKEAREKSLKNQMDVTEAIKCIESVAETGKTSVCFNGKNLSDTAAMELMQKGYSVSKHEDPFGIKYYKADW